MQGKGNERTNESHHIAVIFVEERKRAGNDLDRLRNKGQVTARRTHVKAGAGRTQVWISDFSFVRKLTTNCPAFFLSPSSAKPYADVPGLAMVVF